MKHFRETIRIENGTNWQGKHFIGCTIVTPPRLKHVFITHCTFDACTFLYDGMEVDPLEWQALLSRTPM